MEIKHIAHASFQIKTKTSTVVTDPFSNDIGIKFPKVPADIVTLSHAHRDHDNVKGIEGTPVVLDWPGEYEIKSTFISGISTFHDSEGGATRGGNVCFKIISEGISVLHAGDLGHLLTDSQVEAIGNVDILLIPVGGKYTIDATVAAQVVKQIDPYIVIPMHYGHPRLDQGTFGELQPVSEFLKAMSIADAPPTLPKLSVKREDFATETGTKVIFLEITA